MPDSPDGIDAPFPQRLTQPIQGGSFKIVDLLSQLPVQGCLVSQLSQRIDVGQVDHGTPRIYF